MENSGKLIGLSLVVAVVLFVCYYINKSAE